MKQIIFTLFIFINAMCFAQYPLVSIHDIQYKDDASLSLEDDLSNYDGDTVRVQGLVTFNPCTYALSTSGTRIGTYLADPDSEGPWTALHVLIDSAAIVYEGDLQSLNDASYFIDNFQVGNIVESTGVVSTFDGNTQLLILPTPSSISGFGTLPTPHITTIDTFEMSDGAGGQVMQTLTGEQYESVYVEFQNVYVTDVTPNGADRWNWFLQDAAGNKIRIRDVSGYFRNDTETDDECSIWSGGAVGETSTPDYFEPPTIGTYLSYVRGVIVEAYTGTEYTLAPLTPGDIGTSLASPPTIVNITRNPVVAASTDNVTVSATVTDIDGTVASATIFYSYGYGSTVFTSTPMVNIAGDTWQGVIPGPGIDSMYVNFYIESTDNDGNVINTPAPGSPLTYIVYDDGITSIARIQFTPNLNGNSLWMNDSITTGMDITAIVTASKGLYDLGSLYIQDSENPWSGINVISVPGDETENLYRGDKIHLTGAKVIENFGQTTLRSVAYTKVSAENPLPAFTTGLNPVNIDAKVFGESEPYEGMLLKFNNVFETMDNADPAATDPVYGFGEWKFNTVYTPDTGLRVDDLAYPVFFEFGVDSLNESDELAYIQGVLSYSFSNYKLEPRDLNDIAGFTTVYPNSITAFNLTSLTPSVNGIVNEAAGTITLNVPIGTDVSSLVPSITFTGQYVNPDPSSAQDFTNPVVYTCYSPVTYSPRSYTVTVQFVNSIDEAEDMADFIVYPNPVSDIISAEFSFAGIENIFGALKDISGRNIMEFRYLTHGGKNILPIDLRGLTNGLYLLQIRSSNNMITQKIEVSK